MIEEHAKVVDVEGDQVWVEVQRQSACGQCVANKACGTAVLQKVLGKKRTVLRVLSDVPVKIGDTVVVGLDESAFLKGSFSVYLLPLLLMFIFGLLGETLGLQLFLMDQSHSNSVAVVFALIGLLVGGYWLKRFNSIVHKDPRFQPVILRQSRQTHSHVTAVSFK